MENYYEPDDRWEMYSITNKEQFEQQFVVKGYFHAGVPNDVKDAFTTVEYLLAHSYYYWPMYDEAFNKVLRLLEMAIKQKAIKEGVQVKTKSFDKLIKEICKESYHDRLRNDLQRARKIRNDQVHADSNSYSGAIGGKGKNIQLFVNIINELFRDENWLISQFEKQQAIQEQLKAFENSLLVLENNVPAILVTDILRFRILDETLFLVLNPVLRNTKKSLEEHKYSNPIAIAFSNFEFQGKSLIGTSTENHEIKIYKTDKVENILQLANHIKEFNSESQTDRSLYEYYINNEASWSLVKLEYNYLSKTQKQPCHLPNLTV
jgi:hypothetical protein